MTIPKQLFDADVSSSSAAGRTAQRHWVHLWLLACLVLFLGGLKSCSRAPREPNLLRLSRVPNEPNGVFLNERLIFTFTEELESETVHPGSVRVQSASGATVPGDLTVQGKRIEFVPAPVTRADLSDGGWLPSTRYFVELSGFPYPGCLRSSLGAPLARTVRWDFQTVDAENPKTGFLFEDPTPSFGSPIALGVVPLVSGQPIRFLCDEPLDPRSVFSEDFVLRRQTLERDQFGDRALGERIPLQAFIADNRPPEEFSGQARTELVLAPLQRLEPGQYWLYINPYPWTDSAENPPRRQPGLRLQDLGGNKVFVQMANPTHATTIEVIAETSSVVFREEFQKPTLRSSQEVQDADGTAHWGATGRVELRYPAAAGDGSAGDVTLSGPFVGTDLGSTDLLIAEGARVELQAQRSTVILRSQGRMEIAGSLRRDQIGEPLEFPSERARSLSEFLEWAEGQERGWTILVAGGDMVISGDVRLPGGVLLVAGGRLRISGKVHTWPDRPDLDPFYLSAGSAGSVRNTLLRPAADRLFVDAPIANPLAKPLVFAVMSGPVPPTGEVRRWRDVLVGASKGAGDYRVRFVPSGGGELGLSSGRIQDQPGRLAGGSLRLLLELHMPAAGPESQPWNPPSVDFVELTFEGQTTATNTINRDSQNPTAPNSSNSSNDR